MDLSMGFIHTQVNWILHKNFKYVIFVGAPSEEVKKNPALIEDPASCSYLVSDYPYKHIPYDYKHVALLSAMFRDAEPLVKEDMAKMSDLDGSKVEFKLLGPFIPYNTYGIPKMLIFRAKATIKSKLEYKDDNPEKYNNEIPIFSNGNPDESNNKLSDRSLDGYVYVTNVQYNIFGY